MLMKAALPESLFLSNHNTRSVQYDKMLPRKKLTSGIGKCFRVTMFWKFLGQIFPRNAALSCIVTSIYGIRVTRQDSKNFSAEKTLCSWNVSTLLFFNRSGRPSCTDGRTLCRHVFYSCGFGRFALLSLYSPCAGLFFLFWM